MPSQNELAAQLGLSVPNPRGPLYGNVSQSPLPPSAQGLGDRVQRKEDKKVLDISTNGNGVAAARVRVPMLGATFELRVDAQDVESFIQNPELARQVMERKFGEFRQMSQAVTQNMTPLQKAALAASMQTGGAPNPVAGGLGLAADMEMYLQDPDSRTLGNYMWSALASGGEFTPFLAGIIAPSIARSMRDPNADSLWHPLGTRKLQKPLGEVELDTEVVRDLPPARPLRPEDLEGASIVALPGDRSNAGLNLRGVDGTQFEEPVYLEGGHGFMRTHEPYGQAWAAGKGKATNISNRIRAAGEQSDRVIGSYVSMGPQSVDFSTMMSDTLYEMIRGSKITKKARREFDQELKKIRPEWPGIDAPEARALLDQNGALRTSFVGLVDKKKYGDMGFPDPAVARYAVTDPVLLDAPMYAGGISVAEMDPLGAVSKDPALPHKTYDTQFAGKYLGGLSAPVPYETMFPDFFAARRAEGKPLRSDIRSFELSPPTQLATPEWVDSLSRYLEGVAK